MTQDELVVSLLIASLTRANELGALITNARAQGRDVSTAELDAWRAKDDAMRATFQADIDRAKAEGR
jgi:hypothetical protein